MSREGGSDDDGGSASRETLQVRHQRLCLERRLFSSKAVVKVGRFVLGTRLGTGGMGTVYEAHDPSLDRRVAIKVLVHRLRDDSHAVQRLIREAKAMARLSHPNVLVVHEVGVEAGQPFIAMELMPGGSLAQWMKSHPPAEPGRARKILELLRQCAAGLAAAHRAGLVHRDFKPANVLLSADGRAKVADFGLVRLAEEAESLPGSDLRSPRSDDASLTADGARPGTRQYMAPEQHEGIADARSDQWALCHTFREVFGSTPRPAGVDAVLRRGIAENPDDRFASLDELLDALPDPTRVRTRTMVVAALVVGGLAATASWFARGPEVSAPVAHHCDDGRDQLETAWGAGRQAQIQRAFEDSGSESWRRAWTLVRERFDDYTARWSEARVDACEATHLRRVQDEATMHARLACLDQRREILEGLSETYASAGAKVVEDAMTTSHALPPLADCTDRTVLFAQRGDQPPRSLADPEVRALYEAVGQARVASLAGDRDEAQAQYESMLGDLESLQLHRLHAAVLRELTEIVLDHDLPRARALGQRALEQAELSGSDAEALQAWLVLSEVATRQRKLEDAELFIKRAEVIVARNPDAVSLAADTADARGSVEDAQGHSEAALAAFDRAIELRERIGIPTVIERTSKINPLSRLGRDDEAAALGRQLLTEADETYGPSHPVALRLRGLVAQLYVRRADWKKADELLSPVLRIPMRPDRAQLLTSLRMIAVPAAQAEGKLDEARAILEGLLAEAPAYLSEDDPVLDDVRLQLGAVHIESERFDEALTLLQPLADRTGRSPTDSADGTHPINRCGLWVNVALATSGTGDHEAATEAADTALGICRAAAGERSVYLFPALRYAAEVFENAGRTDRARKLYAEAAKIAESVEVAPAELTAVREGLARLG